MEGNVKSCNTMVSIKKEEVKIHKYKKYMYTTKSQQNK